MPSDWNDAVIKEFRASGGKPGGNFEGASLLILHTTGARTGRAHQTPVMYREIDGGYAVFASFAGGPENPAWYHNVVANPQVTAEIGTRTLPLTARVASDAERAPIWAAQKTEVPGFAEYETMTTRQIPVVILEPTAG